MYKVLILIMGVLLGFPTTSLAADWLRAGQAGAVTQNVSPGGYVINIPVDENDDSPVLSTASCENIDILYFVDSDGNGIDDTITVQVHSCPSTSAGEATADEDKCWPIENVTLSGTYPTDAIYGAAAGWIYAQAGGTDVASNTVELLVRCNGSGTP